MSANNQVLVKEFKGRWYVFNNIMAESWSDKNELNIKEAISSFSTEEKAMEYAYKVDAEEDEFVGFNSEYGVSKKLVKDNADVTIIR